MYKRALLSFLLVLGVAFADANAATARGNARGTAIANNSPTATQAAAPVAARAGARQKVVSNNVAVSSANGNVSARAGKKQTVKATPNTTAAAPTTAKPMAARAGATQKVINTGQKVNTATTNSAVPQECQDAFYGCMDSFCMLDNASGGRCQCNDKIVELDKILDEIMEMDKKSYAMATEGVERIQMGEAEEQLMAKVQNVTASVQKNKSQTSTSDDDDVQQDGSDEVSSFINKKGNELYKASASMCIKSFPEQCKQYGQMLQLVYAQKIKSDCSAYENSLKQQKSESKQKLQTAQKALRDAATEEFQDQNKYGTSGECAIAFAQCMQNDAGCGSDYTECVTLAAKDNVAGVKAKQTTIKGKVANITLSATTMESLLAKKEICQKVIKQCVAANEKQDVWTVFLRNAAPALKTAEEVAEQNLRMQCIPTVAECFKTACKSTIDPNDPDGSYDMCLSNPKTYKSLCKVQLEPCLNATGGTYEEPEKSTLWNGLLSALASMKVDACTTEVKKCLTDRCGEDYSGCVGLDTDSIVNLCPVQKLTACQTDNRFQGGEEKDSEGNVTRKSASDEIRDYVADIAQGLMVQIDNSMLSVCQKALNDSMMKVCGDTEKCDALIKDDKLGTGSLEYKICQFEEKENGDAFVTGVCRSSLDQITGDDLERYGWIGGVTGLMYWGNIDYDFNTYKFTTANDYIKRVKEQFGNISPEDEKQTQNVFDTEIAYLEKVINNTISAIEADPTVTYCMTGREVQGFNAGKIGKKTKRVFNEKSGKYEMADASASRFPNLTDQVKRIIIANTLRDARDNYDKKYNAVYEQLMTDQVAAAAKVDRNSALEIAKNTCDTWALNSVLPRSKTPTNVWMWIGIALAVAASVVATIFTLGAAGVGCAATLMANAGLVFASVGTVTATTAVGTIAASTVAGIAVPALTATTTTAVTAGTLAGAVGVAAGAAAGVAGTVATAVIGGTEEVNKSKSDTMAEPGHAKLDQWNYRATITTIFDVKTGECTKETVYQNCAKESWTTGKCKAWDSEKTEVQKIKLL